MKTVLLEDDEQELIATMLSFAEENWSAFTYQSEERGTIDADIDEVFSKLQGKL